MLVKFSDHLLVSKRCGGFTLAEILVVLIVIGIAAGLAYAQLDRDPRQALEREGRRFAGALEHAALSPSGRTKRSAYRRAAAANRFCALAAVAKAEPGSRR